MKNFFSALLVFVGFFALCLALSALLLPSAWLDNPSTVLTRFFALLSRFKLLLAGAGAAAVLLGAWLSGPLLSPRAKKEPPAPASPYAPPQALFPQPPVRQPSPYAPPQAFFPQPPAPASPYAPPQTYTPPQAYVPSPAPQTVSQPAVSPVPPPHAAPESQRPTQRPARPRIVSTMGKNRE